MEVGSDSPLVGGSGAREPQSPQNACIVSSPTPGGTCQESRGVAVRHEVDSLSSGPSESSLPPRREAGGVTPTSPGCPMGSMTAWGAHLLQWALSKPVPIFLSFNSKAKCPSPRQNIYILTEVPVLARGTGAGGIQGSVSGQEKPFVLPKSQAQHSQGDMPGSCALLPHQVWLSSSHKHHFLRITQILLG